MTEAIQAGTAHNSSRRIEALESAVVYRDLLVEEVIHRTKNILQLAVSILGEQADLARDACARRAVRSAQQQILLLCQTQNRLFGPDIAGRGLGVRLADICSAVLQSFSSRAGQVAVRTSISDIRLSRHQEVCISLILQELVTNALKHAFPGGMQGVISVDLHQPDADSECRLIVRDDGIGRDHCLPLSTGMTLVGDFATALGGRFSVASNHGTIAEVTFPLAGFVPHRRGVRQRETIEHRPI